MRSMAWTWLFAVLVGCSEYDVYAGTTLDSWTQVNVEQPGSDILFVIDDSASMTEEQEQLLLNYTAFLDALVSTDADFQIGVVTTDVDNEQAGLFRGGVMTPETPYLEVAAFDALAVGSDGDRTEQGFAAAVYAVDGRNPGFPRENSLFTVVFVSDEDDESFGDVASFVEIIGANHKKKDFAIHGIVGDLPSGCATGTSAAAPGPRYLEAVTLTDGHRESICATDYTALLERVGLEAAGLPDSFELSRAPHGESIVVNVDGIEIPNREVDGWMYDAARNMVVFKGRAIPEPGRVITARYRALTGASAN